MTKHCRKMKRRKRDMARRRDIISQRRGGTGEGKGMRR
jgi:hypothetical protein